VAASLRTATAADAPRLAELVDAAYGEYVQRLGRPPRPMTDDYAAVVRDLRVTVAELDGEIAGLLVLAVDEEGFLIDNVAVHPALQGLGLGRQLLELAEQEARRAGFDSIYLYTHELITERIAMYERIGYVEFDRRPAGEGKVVYMRKALGPTSAG
jgi:ribosomal protein S18 acetylase RimI-like enzyme